jgi:predicted nucleic acid-binding Zn ribbon protein
LPEPAATAPEPRLEGVAKRQDGPMLGSPVCLACRAVIPRPRRGQRACSPRCRWRLWKTRQPSRRLARDQEIRELLTLALSKLEGR